MAPTQPLPRPVLAPRGPRRPWPRAVPPRPGAGRAAGPRAGRSGAAGRPAVRVVGGGAGPVRLAVPGRTLVLVAGVPGAGKSTMLARLPTAPDTVVLDSEEHRAALARVLPGVPYHRYRALVHLRHRAAVLRAACSRRATVVVHLPATAASTRAAVTRIAALTGRAAHLVWLDVPAAEALRGQRERGRLVPARSFAGHAERAAATAAVLRAGGAERGWAGVTVLDRAAAARGLALDTQ